MKRSSFRNYFWDGPVLLYSTTVPRNAPSLKSTDLMQTLIGRPQRHKAQVRPEESRQGIARVVPKHISRKLERSEGFEDRLHEQSPDALSTYLLTHADIVNARVATRWGKARFLICRHVEQ